MLVLDKGWAYTRHLSRLRERWRLLRAVYAWRTAAAHVRAVLEQSRLQRVMEHGVMQCRVMGAWARSVQAGACARGGGADASGTPPLEAPAAGAREDEGVALEAALARVQALEARVVEMQAVEQAYRCAGIRAAARPRSPSSQPGSSVSPVSAGAHTPVAVAGEESTMASLSPSSVSSSMLRSRTALISQSLLLDSPDAAALSSCNVCLSVCM